MLPEIPINGGYYPAEAAQQAARIIAQFSERNCLAAIAKAHFTVS